MVFDEAAIRFQQHTTMDHVKVCLVLPGITQTFLSGCTTPTLPWSLQCQVPQRSTNVSSLLRSSCALAMQTCKAKDGDIYSTLAGTKLTAVKDSAARKGRKLQQVWIRPPIVQIVADAAGAG